jgi:hypothetical protein
MGRVLLIVCGALVVAALSCLMQVVVPKAAVWLVNAALDYRPMPTRLMAWSSASSLFLPQGQVSRRC